MLFFSKQSTQKWLIDQHLHSWKDVAISGYERVNVVVYKRSKKGIVLKTYSVRSSFKDVIEDGLLVSLYVPGDPKQTGPKLFTIKPVNTIDML